MDIVIGVGRLCGFVIPENFNRPYAARNLLDLWSRWHMTLTDWFKTYLFNPLLKVLSEAWGTPTRLPYLGVVAFFVSFLVMGMWHGSRNIFVVYGLLQGAGVAINKLYQVEAARRLGKKEYGALCKMGSYRHLMRGICIAFFAVAVSCLWLSEDEASALTSLTGLATALVGFALLAGAIALAGAVIESALQRLPDLIQSTSVAFFMSVLFCLSLSEEHLGEMVQVNRIPFVLAGFALLAGGIALANRAADYVLQKRTAFASRGFATSIHVAPVWMAIRLLVTVYLAMSCGAAPEFVYKGF